MRLAYGVRIRPASEWAEGETGFVATIRDFDRAATQGETIEEVTARAADLLYTLVEDAIERGLDLPAPSPLEEGETLVDVPFDIAAIASIYLAMRAQRISKVELARRMGKDEKEVRRLLDPSHGTRISTVRAALEALGQKVSIELAPV